MAVGGGVPASDGHDPRSRHDHESFHRHAIVEATVHYLDLSLDMPDAAPAQIEGLALVRRVVEGLIARSLPIDELGWSPASLALRATGREALTVSDRAVLGKVAERLPAFG